MHSSFGAAVTMLDASLGVLDVLQDLFASRIKFFAAFGHRHMPGAPSNELNPEIGLKPRHALGNGGYRQVHPLRRGGEAAVFDDARESKHSLEFVHRRLLWKKWTE